jgi:hypothetical protein
MSVAIILNLAPNLAILRLDCWSMFKSLQKLVTLLYNKTTPKKQSFVQHQKGSNGGTIEIYAVVFYN